jgi:hypothetical protein
MIQIVLLLFLFLLYVSANREGLTNYMPIVKDKKVYGVNVIKGSPEHIYNKLMDETGPLFDPRFKSYTRADILLDMQYFNNASYIIFQQSQ